MITLIYETCHACEDTPSDAGEVRLLCGGSRKGKNIRSHPFHVKCWKQAMIHDKLLVDQDTIDGWDGLAEEEQKSVTEQLAFRD